MDSFSNVHKHKTSSIDIKSVEYVDLTEEARATPFKENSSKISCIKERKEHFQTTINQFYRSVSACKFKKKPSTKTKMQLSQRELRELVYESIEKRVRNTEREVIDLCEDSEMEIDTQNEQERKTGSNFRDNMEIENENSLITVADITAGTVANKLLYPTKNWKSLSGGNAESAVTSSTSCDSFIEESHKNFDSLSPKEEPFLSIAATQLCPISHINTTIYNTTENYDDPGVSLKEEQVINELPDKRQQLLKAKVIKNNNKTMKKVYGKEQMISLRTIESEKNKCPSYKRIEGTSFAVDAFNYGQIEDVTSYFLTHFHADHYIGLTRKFLFPIYASEITVNLIKVFKKVDEKLLHIISLNVTSTIEGVLVTALEANHCPGAIMLLFQLPCGKQILHTGDFRATPKMESNIYLRGQNIDLLYLDTTNISEKKRVRSQDECISSAIQIIGDFKELNQDKRILFVVCTDLIGKEKFWLSIARAFDFKIWSDDKRKKALRIIGNDEILAKLVDEAKQAELHIVSQAKGGYNHIDEYWNNFKDSYDMVFTIVTKGPHSRSPQHFGEVNLVTIRYSEHSSHKELRRFLEFLRPNRVVSTVPLSKSLTRCAKIPVSWHCKKIFAPYKKQVPLTCYFDVKKI